MISHSVSHLKDVVSPLIVTRERKSLIMLRALLIVSSHVWGLPKSLALIEDLMLEASLTLLTL